MHQQADAAAVASGPVTVVGLGPMGQALAGAFLAAGHPTTVWNRTAARADALVARGALRAATVAGAVTASPLVIACLVDHDAVRAVLGPVAEALEGRTLVNLSSASPGQARETAAWAAGAGIDYLGGAIMTPTPAIGRPSALVLYSGREDVYQAHLSTLAGLGGTASYLGSDPGRAAAHDVALLAVFWSLVSGLVHGLALARAEGIPGSALAPLAQPLFGMLPEMMSRFARQLDEGRHPGERSTVDSAAASLGHIIHTAQGDHIDAGVLTAFKAVVQRAIDAGHGADGLSRLAATLADATPARG
ncbi:NAD(P)-dependent oxidoreductase [Microbispora sp. NPDC049125]|uniref:NAD(P)-dependent oxidoreductase n=1 Tax=Microbispora sp. NPDC049125 TaxID=3154929 RepID=UPI00346559D7